MRNYTVQLFALALLAIWSPAQAADGQQLQVKVLAVRAEGDQVRVDFQVKNSLGGDLLNLKAPDITIVEEDTKLTIRDDQFSRQRTDERNPTIHLTQEDGTALDLSAASATISIVFDAVSRPRANDSDPDTLAASRSMLKQFLCLSDDCTKLRTKVPTNAEAIGLFIPPNQSGAQVTQPLDFKDFPQEAGIEILNYLTVPRSAPTKLYATLKEAVKATADKADERGGPAVVVVMSNHGDDYDDRLFNDIGTLAQDRKVTIVTFRAGKEDAQTDDQFRRLAAATGGVFEAAPDAATVAKTFEDMVAFSQISLYTARYTTKLTPDGQPKHVYVSVKRGSDSGTSDPKAFNLAGRPAQLTPLMQALSDSYLLPAVAISLLISLLIVLLTGAARWGRGRSTGISR